MVVGKEHSHREFNRGKEEHRNNYKGLNISNSNNVRKTMTT
jgi:hypothetical protein